MPGEHIVPQSELIRAILLEISPCLEYKALTAAGEVLPIVGLAVEHVLRGANPAGTGQQLQRVGSKPCPPWSKTSKYGTPAAATAPQLEFWTTHRPQAVELFPEAVLVVAEHVSAYSCGRGSP